MNSADDIEKKLLKAKLLKDMEHTFDMLKRGPATKALVSAIVAEDAAESERSIRFSFDEAESAAIFKAAETALQARYKALRAELGVK